MIYIRFPFFCNLYTISKDSTITPWAILLLNSYFHTIISIFGSIYLKIITPLSIEAKSYFSSNRPI